MEVFTAGLALAFSVLISLIATVHKLPPWLKAWLVRHRLITDVVVFLGITAFLTFISKSVISLIASTMATLAVSLGLEGLCWWEKRRIKNGLPPMFGEANPITKPEPEKPLTPKEHYEQNLRSPEPPDPGLMTMAKAVWYAATEPTPK